MEIDKKYADFIKRQTWTFASTMKNTPHWYIVKARLSYSDKKIFEEFVQYIRDVGTPARYWGYHFPYLHYDGFYYWTMGSPIPDTKIINRASDKTNEIRDGYMYQNGVKQFWESKKKDGEKKEKKKWNPPKPHWEKPSEESVKRAMENMPEIKQETLF